MAYIDKETYNIYCETFMDGEVKNCFQCDDAIAPAVRVLNIKGYHTVSSCSGHPFLVKREVIVACESRDEVQKSLPGCYNINEVIKKDEQMESFPQFIGLKDKKPELRLYKANVEQFLYNEAFIAFNDGNRPDVTPPEGWILGDEDDICALISKDPIPPMEFFEKQLEIMKELIEWVKELPFRH